MNSFTTRNSCMGRGNTAGSEYCSSSPASGMQDLWHHTQPATPQAEETPRQTLHPLVRQADGSQRGQLDGRKRTAAQHSAASWPHATWTASEQLKRAAATRSNLVLVTASGITWNSSTEAAATLLVRQAKRITAAALQAQEPTARQLSSSGNKSLLDSRISFTRPGQLISFERYSNSWTLRWRTASDSTAATLLLQSRRIYGTAAL